MDNRSLARDLRLFSEAANIDSDNYEKLVQLRLVMSFAHIDQRRVFEEVCGCDQGKEHCSVVDVDWGTVENFLNGDQYGNCYAQIGFWLKFLTYIQFEDEPAVSPEISQYLEKIKMRVNAPNPASISALDAVRVAVFRVCGESVQWSDICKIYLLTNVIRDDPSAGVNAFLRAGQFVVDDGTDTIGMQVSRYLMGFRSQAEQHEETLTTLLTSYMRVAVDDMSGVFEEERQVTDQVAHGMKSVFLQRLRPSLTEIAARHQPSNGAAQGGLGGYEKENFQTFSSGCRFPLNMSNMMQRLIYFYKAISDTELDTTKQIEGCVSCPVLFGNIQKMSVVSIEIPVILSVITCARNVGEPSVALKHFRCKCMEPFFSGRQMQHTVNWTVVLKLYLAAMQRKSIRSECWRLVVQRQSNLQWDQGCNAETMNAVNGFVQSERFDTEYALGMLVRSIRSVDHVC